MVWGIENDTRRVVGTRFKPGSAKVGAQILDLWLHQYLRPKLDFRFDAFDYQGQPLVLLLFGKDESAQFLPLPPQVSWVLKDADGTVLDYQHYGLPLLLAPDALFARVRNLTVRYMPPGTLFPTEVPQYDAWVIREALHNAIAHQDYAVGGRVNVIENQTN